MATFWEKAANPVDRIYSLCILSTCNVLFPIWVLWTGFGFGLLKFLVIAYSLLLKVYVLKKILIEHNFTKRFWVSKPWELKRRQKEKVETYWH